jgi:hypothetical protein
MKKILLAAFLLTTLSAVVLANTNNTVTPNVATRSGDGRHISASEVPAPVLASFNERFPTATRVRWEVEREHGGRVYEAEFTMNGKRFKAEFAPDGTFLGKERDNSGSGSGN